MKREVRTRFLELFLAVLLIVSFLSFLPHSFLSRVFAVQVDAGVVYGNYQGNITFTSTTYFDSRNNTNAFMALNVSSSITLNPNSQITFTLTPNATRQMQVSFISTVNRVYVISGSVFSNAWVPANSTLVIYSLTTPQTLTIGLRVLQPVTLTLTGGGTSGTFTVAGCSTTSTTIFANGVSHTLNVTASCSLTITVTADNLTSRFRYTGGPTTWSFNTCVSGTCVAQTNTYYDQLSNTYEVVATGRSAFDAGMTWTITGTLLGSAGTVCTIPSTTTATDSCTAWADYNTAVTFPPNPTGSPPGTAWALSGTGTFTDTTGGNTHDVGYVFYSSSGPGAGGGGFYVPPTTTTVSSSSGSMTTTIGFTTTAYSSSITTTYSSSTATTSSGLLLGLPTIPSGWNLSLLHMIQVPYSAYKTIQSSQSYNALGLSINPSIGLSTTYDLPARTYMYFNVTVQLNPSEYGTIKLTYWVGSTNTTKKTLTVTQTSPSETYRIQVQVPTPGDHRFYVNLTLPSAATVHAWTNFTIEASQFYGTNIIEFLAIFLIMFVAYKKWYKGKKMYGHLPF